MTENVSIQEVQKSLLSICEMDAEAFAQVMGTFYFDPPLPESELEAVLDRVQIVSAALIRTPTDSRQWNSAALVDHYLCGLAERIRKKMQKPTWSDRLVGHLLKLLLS